MATPAHAAAIFVAGLTFLRQHLSVTMSATIIATVAPAAMPMIAPRPIPSDEGDEGAPGVDRTSVTEIELEPRVEKRREVAAVGVARAVPSWVVTDDSADVSATATVIVMSTLADVTTTATADASTPLRLAATEVLMPSMIAGVKSDTSPDATIENSTGGGAGDDGDSDGDNGDDNGDDDGDVDDGDGEGEGDEGDDGDGNGERAPPSGQ